MNTLINVLIIVDIVGIFGFLYFSYESWREQETRAVHNGLAGSAVMVVLGVLLFIPVFQKIVIALFIIVGILSFSLLIPSKPNEKALKGSKGYLVGMPERFDERDSVFARFRNNDPNSAHYKEYYNKLHPGKESLDEERRKKGLLGTPGKIDDGYQPNIAMMHAAFSIPPLLGEYAINEPNPDVSTFRLSPEKASLVIKEYASHLGADMVGICKVDEDLLYSHRGEIHYGNFEDWGKKIKGLPAYALVFLTEMKHGHVISAPHTPTVTESAHLYARGAYVSTLLSKWFSYMGYKGIAEHTRNYDLPLVPLAADAGLGEVGRQGYLVSPKFGARARIFAVLTDMPLKVDKPISLGVEEFCQSCKKCADTCPSQSIPHGEKVIFNGFSKWKLDEEACFDFWGKVGTDCCICMAICPFSRPNTILHRTVREFVLRSRVAQIVFPHVDNFLYGKKWKPKKVSAWLNPKG